MQVADVADVIVGQPRLGRHGDGAVDPIEALLALVRRDHKLFELERLPLRPRKGRCSGKQRKNGSGPGLNYSY